MERPIPSGGEFSWNGRNASGANDPYDPNKDGKINVADVRYCQLRLTPP